MNFHGITKASFVDGEGIRTVLWVAGCDHHCSECHNSYTWNPDGGVLFDSKAAEYLIHCLEKPYIDGLTLSGGDPMYLANRQTVTFIAEHVKKITHKSIWMYTGYLWEQIKDEPIMKHLDVVVDGEFKKELAPAKYVGSNNQRVIDVQKSLQTEEIVLWD